MSLQGQLLVASRELSDPNFARSVVLIVEHGDEGAMGLVLNRPTQTTVQEAWRQVSETPCPADAIIHLGGPCRGPLMVVHTAESLGEIEVSPGIYFCVEPEKIEQLITQAEGSMRFFVGFAGWSAGQLELEMAEDAWQTAAATAEHVFGSPQELWQQITRQISSSLILSALNIKHIPSDPSLN